MTQKEVTLYRGDNGAQEFWENSTTPHILIFRNHTQKEWLANIDGQVLYDDKAFLVTTQTPQQMAQIIQNKHNVKITFSTEKEWVRNPKTRDGFPMILKQKN